MLTLQITSLFLSFLIIGLPLFFIKKPPKKINPFYGYRTSKTLNNQKAWDFANNFWAKTFLYLSILTICIGGVIYFLYGPIAFLTSTSIIWLSTIGVSIFLTEQKLKHL